LVIWPRPVKSPDKDRNSEMSQKHVCVCGKLADKPLPKGIDGLFVKGQGFKPYERVCRDCYRRIKRLDERFKPSFGGCDAVIVVYDPESRLFTIRAYNEYGDSAFLREDMKETRSYVRSTWTREVVVLDGDRVVGVI